MKHHVSGSAIPGSKLIRWYCDECGVLIRVARVRRGAGRRLCECCSGERERLMVRSVRKPQEIGADSPAPDGDRDTESEKR